MINASDHDNHPENTVRANRVRFFVALYRQVNDSGDDDVVLFDLFTDLLHLAESFAPGRGAEWVLNIAVENFHIEEEDE